MKLIKRLICKLFGHSATPWVKDTALMGEDYATYKQTCIRCKAEQYIIAIHSIDIPTKFDALNLQAKII